MSDVFAALDLTYVRRVQPLGDLIGGFAERWKVRDAGGVVLAVVEEELAIADRLSRLVLSNRFGHQQRHRLQVADAAGRPLFRVLRQPPKLGLDYAEIRGASGAAVGVIALTRPIGSDRLGFGLCDTADTRLGEAVQQGRSVGGGRRAFDIHAADRTRIGQFAATAGRSRSADRVFRLQLTTPLSDPLRTLVYATPIVSYFLLLH